MIRISSLVYIFSFLIVFQIKKIKAAEVFFNLYLNKIVSFTLNNNNIIIFSYIGFFTFDSNYVNLYNYTFSTELSLNDDFKHLYPSFTQFSEEEGGYVMCYILKNVYIFDNYGKFIYLADANETSIIEDGYNNYVINSYKKENSEYYFTIITFDFSLHYYGELQMFYYKINILNKTKELIYNNIYLNNNTERIEGHNTICCEKMITNNNDTFITCLYQYMSNNTRFIGEMSFKPDYNFTYIEPKKYLKLFSEINNYQFSSSVTNEDKSKLYICYLSDSTNASCFYYDINIREFSKIHYLGYNGRKGLYYINLFFFKESNEFIFSCVDTMNIFSFVKFKENITLIQPNVIGKYDFSKKCYDIRSFSIVYSSKDKQYFLINSANCNSNILLYKFNITNFFNTTENEEFDTDSIFKETNTSETLITEINKSTFVSLSTKISGSTHMVIPKTYLSTEIIEPKISTLINIVNTSEIIGTSQINIVSEKSSILKNSYTFGCNDYKKILNEKNECVCDNANGYYSKIYKNIIDNKCYSDETKPGNFYLNKETKLYEMCHKYCLTCYYHGNEDENNCTSCVNGYIFTPDIDNTVNCVPKCQYLYYFNSYDVYSCTKSYQCPLEAYLLIRNKSKCIDNCSKDDKYKYQYSGECYEKCPDETNNNEYKCEVKNINSCSLSNFHLNLTIDDIIENNINSYTKNYVEEFNYTDNQIINYINKDYSLVLYKNSTCIKEFSLNVPQIYFGDCYEKIKITYNISDDLLIAILDKYIENENSITTYLLFNPINGERINANEICKNDIIIIKENILTLPGVDPYLIKFFLNQNINVFNVSDEFYKDICKHYISPNGKDLPLKLRIQMFYPNVSLCDDNCINKGVDLKAMESICHCPFNDLSQNSFISNSIKYNEFLGTIYSLISNSNFDVLYCIKVIFHFDHLKRCLGGLIIIIILLFQTICVILYNYKSKFDYKRYIFNLSNNYRKSLLNLKNAPPKIKKIKNKNNKTKSIMIDNSSSSNHISYLSKYTNQIIIQNINTKNMNNAFHKREKGNNNEKNNNTFFNEYLSTDPNEMDYDDALEKDKRSFLQYFIQTIKEKHLIVNTFFIVDNIKPKTIKLISFLLKFDFYLLFNGMIYSESFLIELYNNDDNSFFNFVYRNFEHLFYIFIITKIGDEFLECFFIKEKKVKGILIRGKNKMKKINEDFIILIKKIEKYYLVFIIMSYIIIFLSMIYISCFNDVYYYTRSEWIKSSLFFFGVMQIVSIILFLIETIIRYIGIKCKNEKIFRLSKIIF